MKNKIKSVFISLLIYLVIILISHFISKSIGNYDEYDFYRVYITSFIVLYIPVLISICFFKKEKNWKFYFKSPIISFFTVYFFVFLYFKQMEFRESYSFFEVATLMNGIMSFFTTIFINFILIINSKKNYKGKILIGEISYSNKKLIFIPFLASLIYSILISVSSSSFINAIYVWSSFFPLGILIAFISINFFKYLSATYNGEKKVYIIISYYIISILLCVAICTIRIITNTYNFNFDSKFLINLVLSMVLFAPFFLFIIFTTHLYFLDLLSKKEKETLTQQSLESQLNYQQLKNQLSPHFLFNNINVLTSLIEENPKKAVDFSENLSHIYRYFLEQEKQDVVLVKHEVEFAESYLKLLKDRFEVGLNFFITIDENYREKYIISTILQQVLENVVKHNTINEANIVDVKITSEENYLVIENNKNPKLKIISESKKGIENIKKRIAFFTEEKVIVEDLETCFVIKLPILETV
jgi:sensor histidine kinase YesM